MSILKIRDSDKNWQSVVAIKGDKGDAFVYDDFTDAQLDALKGADGLPASIALNGITYEHQDGNIDLGNTVGIDVTGKTINAGTDYEYTGGTNAETFNGGGVDGIYNTASGAYSHAEGSLTKALGVCSHAEGNGTTANYLGAHAEGVSTVAERNGAHAEGVGTYAQRPGAHAEGNNTKAQGPGSHAEGNNTTVNGEGAHVEGNFTLGGGKGAHAEGNYTSASGEGSHAEGNYTKAYGTASHVQGKYNVVDEEGVYSDIVGGGTSDEARANIQTLDWDGNAWTAGKYSQDGTPVEDNDLTTKVYTDTKLSETRAYIDTTVESVQATLDSGNLTRRFAVPDEDTAIEQSILNPNLVYWWEV